MDADFYLRHKAFSLLLREAERLLLARGDVSNVLRDLKWAAAKVEAAEKSGRIIQVKKEDRRRAKRDVIWVVWAEPEGIFGKAFLTASDLPAVAEAPELFLLKDRVVLLDGAVVFCDYFEKLVKWECVLRCARLFELFLNVTFWAFEESAKRYLPHTTDYVVDLIESVQTPAVRRMILKEMGTIVDIRDLHAIKKLRKER